MSEDENINEINIYEIKHKPTFALSLIEWAGELVFAIAILTIFLTFVVRTVDVNGDSMIPNYYHKEKLMISSVLFEPKVGDVVVITDVLYDPIIKRVIATEGQVVDIDKECLSVYVDGILFEDEDFGIQAGITNIFHTEDSTEFPLVVPKGCVFVLGDNRAESLDSRSAKVGMVDNRKILGKVLLRILPLDRFGSVK